KRKLQAPLQGQADDQGADLLPDRASRPQRQSADRRRDASVEEAEHRQGQGGAVGRAMGRRSRALAGFASLAAALVAASGLLPSRALSDQVGVLIGAPASQVFVGKQEIADKADVEARDYTYRGPSTSDSITLSGISVRTLIQQSPFDIGKLGYLTVPRAEGSTAYLPGSDFSSPPPFPDGPALVYVDGDSTRFFRPVRGDGDINAPDSPATRSGVALRIGLHKGNLLTVDANADPLHVRAGEPVRFTSTASGERSGERLSYQWSFGDGSSGNGQSARHSYAQK